MIKISQLFVLVIGVIGAIGIIESIVNFSLFQTFISVGLIWGAFALNHDLKYGEEEL